MTVTHLRVGIACAAVAVWSVIAVLWPTPGVVGVMIVWATCIALLLDECRE